MKVLGIGNAIVDVICKVEESFLSKNKLTKGTMKLVDESEFKKFEQWKEYWEDIKEYEYKNGGSNWGTRYSLNDPMCV